MNQSNEIDKIKQRGRVNNDGTSREINKFDKTNIIENKIRYSLLSILKHNISELEI